MVVKLYSADGKIRIYRTYRAVGGGDSGPVEYVTDCGMKWKKEPELCQTCSHIDCAIDVQKQAVVELVLILLFLILCSALLIPITSGDILILLSVGFLILTMYFILYIFINRKRYHELEEYKRNGTIDGISAYSDPALDNLITAFDRAIKLNPRPTALWNDKDIGLKALNMQAMAAADRALSFDPQIADAWYLKGMALHAKNEYYEAIAAYDKATMAYEKDTQINDKAAVAYKKATQICYKAMMDFKKFTETSEWHKRAWHKKGLALCMLGRYNEAIYAYDQATEIKPEDADVLHDKGLALRALGRNTEADESLKLARNEWNSEGMDLSNLERHAEAIAVYDKALAVDAKFLCAWVNKGTALFKMGRYEEAIGIFNHAIEINPNNPHAWNRKGLALQKIGRKSEANDAFALARELGI